MADPTKDVALLRAVLQRVLDSQAGKASTLTGNLMADVRGALHVTAPPERYWVVPMFALVRAETQEQACDRAVSTGCEEHVTVYLDAELAAVEYDAARGEPKSVLDVYPTLEFQS